MPNDKRSSKQAGPDDGKHLDEAVQRAGDALGAPQAEIDAVKGTAHALADSGLVPPAAIEEHMEEIEQRADDDEEKRPRNNRPRFGDPD